MKREREAMEMAKRNAGDRVEELRRVNEFEFHIFIGFGFLKVCYFFNSTNFSIYVSL